MVKHIDHFVRLALKGLITYLVSTSTKTNLKHPEQTVTTHLNAFFKICFHGLRKFLQGTSRKVFLLDFSCNKMTLRGMSK